MATRRLVEFCGWTALIGLLAFSLQLASSSQVTAVVVTASAASLVFGVQAFVRHGERRVTVLGLFNISSAMFIGFAGAYAAVTGDPRVPARFLCYAVLAGLAFQVLCTALAWNGARSAPGVRFLASRDSSWAITLGTLGLVFLAAAETVAGQTAISPWIEGAAVAATTVTAVGVLWRPGSRLFSTPSLLLGVAFISYAVFFHSGAGRLRIIALGCALLMLISLRFSYRGIKWGVIALAPIALYVLAQQRLSLQERIAAGGSVGRTGLESMLVPIVVFGRMLEEQANGMPLAWGASFLTFPLIFLPRRWFPGAPEAFGYELVEFYAPEKAGSGFSLAATAAAEGVYNFGAIGVVVVAVAMGWLLRWLDHRFVAAAGAIGTGRLPVLRLAFWAIFGGAIADLAWNGQHIFFTRTVMRVPLLIALAALAWTTSTRERRHKNSRDAQRGTSAGRSLPPAVRQAMPSSRATADPGLPAAVTAAASP